MINRRIIAAIVTIASIAGCAMGDAYRAQQAAEKAADRAAGDYEECLQRSETDCERERRLLEVRQGTLDRRSAENRRQAAEWQDAAESIQRQTEAQQQQQLEREKLEVEREKLRASKRPAFTAPQAKRIDYSCMSDCTKRYSYSYCESACSY